MNTISIVGFILIILVLGALINTLATGAVRLIAFAVLGVIATLLLSNAVRNPSATLSLPRLPNIFRTSQQTQPAPSPAAVGGEATTPAGETPVQQAPASVGGEASFSPDPGSFPQPDSTFQPQPAPAAPAQTPVRGLW
ncbi:hypothetical protein [Thermoleptolyngbya sp. C42_A2020_037]|uniref:hypothetical protein n=1 Tax=Thermoleptolyngbya sp. C42_A2020_037 TaxID=2747799 RepID=UPI001A0D4C95|nr:hypothetical protein [Thermoleptolyngbya sp. C42_A2020_037]MBF2086879.1 hypothetical protein [Thermoleptolyngbya sp. C42_A2020_037]